MATLTIKNVPDELYTQLKELAAANRRSINSEAIRCIERAVGTHRLDPEEIITRARLLREATSAYIVSNEELTEAKNEGRP